MEIRKEKISDATKQKVLESANIDYWEFRPYEPSILSELGSSDHPRVV